MRPGDSPPRRVWTVGPVGVWVDEGAGFVAVWCERCKRLLLLADARLSLDIIKGVAAEHAENHGG